MPAECSEGENYQGKKRSQSQELQVSLPERFENFGKVGFPEGEEQEQGADNHPDGDIEDDFF